MLYTSAVHIAALFSKKVAKMVKGEKEAFSVLAQKIEPGAYGFTLHRWANLNKVVP